MLPVIYTERLTLIALTIEQINQALYHPEMLADILSISLSPDVFSEDSRQAMMVKMARMGHVDPHLHAWYTYFLIVNTTEHCAMGVCGFKGGPTQNGSVEVGYAIHPDFRNKGFMTETVRALVNWAFEQDDCKCVVAETLRDNDASQRVLQKSGLVLERTTDTMLFWKIYKDQVSETDAS